MKKNLMGIVCLSSICCAAAANSGEWMHQYYTTASGTNSVAEPVEAIAKWVNQVCKPNRMSDIKGLTSQRGGAASAYNIHVFCRSGQGVVAVRPLAQTWGIGGGPEFAKTLEGRNLVVLGFYDGEQADSVFLLAKVESRIEED